MVFRHLVLTATHAEAGHFTSRTYALALTHSRAPMLELTDCGWASEARDSPPTTTHSLSRSAIISGGGDYRETPPPPQSTSLQKNPVLSFLLLCSIFPLAAAGARWLALVTRRPRLFVTSLLHLATQNSCATIQQCNSATIQVNCCQQSSCHLRLVIYSHSWSTMNNKRGFSFIENEIKYYKALG